MSKTEALPGMKMEKSEPLSEAIEELRETRRDRMDYTKKETELQAKVLELMHAAGLTAYQDDDYDPPLDAKIVGGKEKIKLKIGSSEDDTEE